MPVVSGYTGNPTVTPDHEWAGLTGTLYEWSGAGTITFSTGGDVYYLVQAGGGAGGKGAGAGGGGGGAGGVLGGLVDSTFLATATTYSIVVGLGGIGPATNDTSGGNGGNSEIAGDNAPDTAIGGGGGGGFDEAVNNSNGNSGGSGGGAGGLAYSGGAGTSGQGSRGGNSGADLGGAAGGTINGPGGDLPNGTYRGGDGADGLTSAITGTAQVYGSSGAGGSDPYGVGQGVPTGGANAGNGGNNTLDPTDAVDGFGGGGGGANGDNTRAGHGGRGTVIMFVPDEEEPVGGFNPTTIMGGAVLSYVDVAEGGMFQNSDGTTAAGDGDPVGYLPDQVGGAFTADNTGWRPTLRENNDDPYLEGSNSSLYRALSRSGPVYAVFRARFPDISNWTTHLAVFGTDLSSFWADANWFVVRKVNDVNSSLIHLENGSAGNDVTTQYTRDVFETFEIYFDGTDVAVAVNGGSFVTASSPAVSSAYLRLFGGLSGGGLDNAAVGRKDIRRAAVINTVPTSGQRTALLDWAENGDTGGGATDLDVPVATVTVAGVAPTVATGAAVSIPVATVSIEASPPTVAAGAAVSIPAATVSIEASPPTVATGVALSIPSSVVSVSANAPTVAGSASVQVPVATVSVSAAAPDVRTGVSVAVPAAVVAVTPQAPTVAVGAAVAVPAAVVAVTPQAPTVAVGAAVAVPAAIVAVSANAPTLDLSDDVVITLPVASVQVTGEAPTVATGVGLILPAATVTVSAQAPSVGTGVLVVVSVASVTVTGAAPAITITDIWQGQAPDPANWVDVPDNSADWTTTIVGTGEWS